MSDALRWYILRVVSGQEKNVKFYIERDMANSNLENHVPQVLVPTEKVFQIRKMKDGKTKRIAIERSFLPGYVLVQANLTDNHSGEIIHQLRSTPGVINFLEVDGNGREAMPKPMPNYEVKRILGRLEESQDDVIETDLEFDEGEIVKVIDGAFSGFTGTVQEVFDEKKKLNVMVKIFGRTTPIELNYVQVEKNVD